MKVQKLKAKIIERGYNVEELAKSIDIDRSSMYRKLNNIEKISIGEAKKIKSALAMTDAEANEIFLN